MGHSTAGKIALGVLVVFSLACILTGGTPYVMAIQSWAEHDHLFTGFLLIDWLVGLLGGAVIAVGLLIAGLVLRFLRWNRAPLASLMLSIMSTSFILTTFLIYSMTGNADDSVEVVVLQALCILGLFVIPLPQFLHWLLARRKIAPAPLKVS
jgi:hypothetical protein